MSGKIKSRFAYLELFPFQVHFKGSVGIMDKWLVARVGCIGCVHCKVGRVLSRVVVCRIGCVHYTEWINGSCKG